MEDVRLLKVLDAARMLSISRAQLYKLANAGALRLVKVGSQASRVPLTDVLRLSEEGIPPVVIQQLRRGGGGRER
jgi:excisionase family DNA binding protein